MSKIVFILLLSLFSSTVFAGGKVVGNGGNSLALEFSKIAEQAITDVDRYPEIFKNISSGDLQSMFNGVEILVSKVPVYSEKNEIKQYSTLINYNNPKTIVIYEAGWEAIKTHEIKKALIIHELLSLLGKETTGDYSISRQYLNKLGIFCFSGLCENIPRYNCLLQKTPSTFIPEILVTKTLGNIGSNSELINLSQGDMRVDINMNTNANGFILIAMNYQNRTVAVSELHGTNYPDTIILNWKDIVTKTQWEVQCRR